MSEGHRMHPRYPLLFAPSRINRIELGNRIVLTAMVTRLSGEDGLVNRDIRDRYLRFARGEPGLIVLEAMSVHGGKSGPLLRISDDTFLPGLRDLALAMHDTSPSKVVPQIIHFLKIARSGWREKVADLGKADIARIVTQYGDAGERARRAGFDGVELHMAHAYTVASFLSRRNHRTDEYGRTLENRMRLMSEIVTEVRSRVGQDFAIGIRFDGEECIKDGYTLNDSAPMALRMARLGADYISISAGGKFEDAIHKPGEPLYPYTGYSGDRCMPGASYADGANVYLAQGIKAYLREHGITTPIVTTGKIATPSFAEQLLAEGKADLIGMARALLADPDWPKKVRDGREAQLIRCVYGNVCKNLDENFRRVVCALWPKNARQAPESDDREPPRWVRGGDLKCEPRPGAVRLTWERGEDVEGLYGYDVFRSDDDRPFTRIAATRIPSLLDQTLTADRAARYYVQAYDLAGNRSVASNVVSVRLSRAHPQSDSGAGS